MSDKSNTAGGFGVGLLIGSVIGVSAALLFAPYRGKRTRQLLREKVDEIWDQGIEHVEEAHEQINEIADKAKKRIEEVINTAIKEGLSENNLGN